MESNAFEQLIKEVVQEDKASLSLQWLNRTFQGEEITVKELCKYSRIRLNKARNKKKFFKNPYRYISKEVADEWFGFCVSSMMAKVSKKMFDLKLPDLEPMPDLPKGNLVYFDYKYENNE